MRRQLSWFRGNIGDCLKSIWLTNATRLMLRVTWILVSNSSKLESLVELAYNFTCCLSHSAILQHILDCFFIYNFLHIAIISYFFLKIKFNQGSLLQKILCNWLLETIFWLCWLVELNLNARHSALHFSWARLEWVAERVFQRYCTFFWIYFNSTFCFS